jgi:N-formylglutamate deformylase
MTPYIIQAHTSKEVPIILSIPHCGTEFPEELRSQYKQELIKSPDDTDWFLNKLYSFALDMGITMISPRYSRWVIDLNRDPESKPLYSDGRIITTLCPTTTFLGQPIYTDERTEVGTDEVSRRVEKYYKPYHQKLKELIEKSKKRFNKVLLWDCHSIRQHVPTIHSQKFPDLILGDADETSSSKEVIDIAFNALQQSNYSIAHNYPFKGGYITRNFGNPKKNIHALQLEMSKVVYMDDAERQYNQIHAAKIQNLLSTVFINLIRHLY